LNHERYKWAPQKIPTLIMAGEKDQITPLKLFEKEKQFCRNNIHFKSIQNAGHFPWIENPTEVAKEFMAYAKWLI
jgi:pimeloyl-ACP methyl ester carboxylesterase